ncbi:amidohydrolase [Brevibacillus ruminantium]|uniref:Amidohydrolase n=1 Tax=Brevibacillus ruminantium TaxID=2950604 RepID=A0ABY4WI98_9BACL|nr:amidohydrolase [Brevibacillus ruminantium]USG66875.1 amidohydrolase [Brevibacillus ruminantium]
MTHTTDEQARLTDLDDRLVAIRRHLHEYPELSGEEFETTARIREWLAEAGIQTADYGLKTGVIAEIGGQSEGPIIALRADIDALPIQEETGLSYASRYPGKMHACGHDFHTAALLGAAFLLKERESELQGRVRLIFQPAEEKALGALQVIESGALEGVRAIFGLHNKPDLPVGTIGIKAGALMAAADGFLLEVKGLGTHAAVPEAGVDPIVAASQIVTSLQSIVSRNIGSQQQAVVSVTRFHSGTSWNVIPEKAILDGTIRTFEEGVRATARERFQQIVEGVAAAYRVQADLRWIQGPPAVRNDGRLAELARTAAENLGLRTVEPPPSPAGEDFAYYQKEVPGLFLFVGTAGLREWHHPAFDLDERALPITARCLAALAGLALGSLPEQRNQKRGEQDGGFTTIRNHTRGE